MWWRGRAVCATRLRRSFREEVFGHVVDKGAQLRREVLARRAHGAEGSDVLDVVIKNFDQRTLRDLSANCEVRNTRESDTELGERHQRLYRRHSGRDRKFDLAVGARLRERPALELTGRWIAMVQTGVRL